MNYPSSRLIDLIVFILIVSLGGYIPWRFVEFIIVGVMK